MLSPFGLFTSSEVVKEQGSINTCYVLGAKQVTEWGAAGRMNIAAEILLPNLTVVMLDSYCGK